MKLSKLTVAMLAAVGAIGLAGAAAAVENSHVISVPLPDGATAKIRYFGDTPPQVRVETAPISAVAWPSFGFGPDIAPDFAPDFAQFDRVMAQMDRQAELMMAQAQRELSAPAAPDGLMQAGLGRLPPGATGYTVVSTLSGSGLCTRTIEYRSTGHGQPQVLTRSSGRCAAAEGQPAGQADGSDQAARLTSVSYRPAS